MYLFRKKSIAPVLTGVAVTTSLASTTTSFVANYPGTSFNGDYIVLDMYLINVSNNTSFVATQPTGWSTITSVTADVSADALGGWTFGKFRGSETSVTVAITQANYVVAIAKSYLGSTVSATNPVNVSTSAINTSSSTTMSPATVTTTIENCALLETVFSVNTAGATSFTYAWGGSFTAQASGAGQIGSAADELGWSTATGLLVNPGATGAATCTSSVSTIYCYATNIALAPATG